MWQRKPQRFKPLVLACLSLMVNGPGLGLHAHEPITLANVQAPIPERADEPFIERFSARQAARYLDTAGLHWLKTKECIACHTMPPYLMARPALAHVASEPVEVRQFFEDLAAGRKEAFPDYLPKDGRTAVLIAIATPLAFHDRATTGRLHPLTRQALDRLWTVQRPDGGWEWPFRDVPPIKISEHYGATWAALGVGLAPDHYAETEAAKKGLEGVRRFLRANAPASLHERLMLLWVAQFLPDVFAEPERLRTLKDLFAAQRSDGGWSLASLVQNVDAEGRKKPEVQRLELEKNYGDNFLIYTGRFQSAYKTPLASDGYATGFAIYVARQAGAPATDERLKRGITWLKRNQRQSGRWFTQSQGNHTRHLISNAGTGYAVLALQACGTLAGDDPSTK